MNNLKDICADLDDAFVAKSWDSLARQGKSIKYFSHAFSNQVYVKEAQDFEL